MVEQDEQTPGRDNLYGSVHEASRAWTFALVALHMNTERATGSKQIDKHNNARDHIDKLEGES